MLLTFLGLLLQPIPGNLVVIEHPSSYEIFGSSADDLRAAMNRLGPKDSKGERHDALTHWTVRWDYRSRAVPGVCALTSFTTTLTIETRLPQWNQRAEALLRKRWDAYLEALKIHEGGHAEMGRRAAREIQEKAATVSSARTCPALDGAIKAAGEAILARYRKEDGEYDRRTQHGLSQGARFP